MPNDQPQSARPIAFTCCHCGRIHNEVNPYAQQGYSSRFWCESCARQYFPNCCFCTNRFYAGDMRVIRNHSGMDRNAPQRRSCMGCFVEARGTDFRGREKQFDSFSSFGSSRQFGVELETNLGKCSGEFAFAAKPDGSISGWEFVSHRLCGDAGLEELRAFMESGQRIEIGDNCGFHLHMSLENFNDSQCRAVYAAYVVTEDYWFNKVGRNRQENNYCYRLPERIFEDIRATSHYYDFAEMQDRYAWINAAAYCRHRTLENRLHHATWDFAEVKAWVILNLRFVEACKSLDFRRGDSWDSYADKVSRCLEWAQSNLPIEALNPPEISIGLAV